MSDSNVSSPLNGSNVLKYSLSDCDLFAAVQNGVILDIYTTYDEAFQRCHDEISRDWISIIVRKKLRKILKKSGNVALHQYYVLHIVHQEEIK